MNRIRTRSQHTGKTALALSALLVTACAAPVRAVTISWAAVGNAGNAADPADGDDFNDGVQHFGAVAYNYNIAKYDVTVGQYTEFLNAVAKTDTYGLYNSSMGTDLNIAGISRNGAPGNYSYSTV